MSRTFHALLTIKMFETLTICIEEHAVAQLGARPYDSLDARRPLECLKLVKHLHLEAPFRQMLEKAERCPHYQLREDVFMGSSRSFLGFDPDEIPKASFALLFKLMPLLQLQEKSLVSFSWDLGVCIPESILGSEGYLTKKQTGIESLSLITTGICYRNRLIQEEIVILSNFPRLRKFSWKGLSSTEELNSLRGLFFRNFRVLEELELDFFNWKIVIKGENRLSFTEAILPHETNGIIQQFRSLKCLSLTEFGFEETTKQITQAFNIRNLQSLTLRNCRGINTFLSTIVKTGLVLRLISLEIVTKDRAIGPNGSGESPLIRFLQSFEGLVHLNLMLRTEKSYPEHWLSCYWNAILHHNLTLKRLIYHERCVQAVTLAARDDWSDPTTLNIWMDKELTRFDSTSQSDAETVQFQENHFYNSGLAQMQLECFGVSDNLHAILHIMEAPMAVQQNIKLLHFRRTGIDYVECEEGYESLTDRLIPGSWPRDDFEEYYVSLQSDRVFNLAKIIFQSPKFVNLQILAFGDFSHGGRYQGRNLLLCRVATSHPEVHFRVMSRDDIESNKKSGLLDLDFLAACPAAPLLKTRDWDHYGEWV